MSHPLDYDRPDPRPHAGRVVGLRGMAAAAGLSAAAAPVVVGLLAWPVGGLFAVGYAVAAALAWRVVARPSLNWRRATWAVALAVFGLWAVVIGSNLTHGKPPASATYCFAWWGVMAAACLGGLLLEPPLPASR